MREDQFKRLMTFIVALGFLSISASLLLAVINLGALLASTWLLLLLQVCLAVLAIVISASICIYLIDRLWTFIMREIQAINQRHADLLKSMKKRAPWFVTLTLLGSQAALAVADKSFNGETLPTVAVTLALILLFFLANELFTRERFAFKLAGYLLWLMTAASLPLLILIYGEFNVEKVYALISAIPIHYRYIYSLLMMAFLAAPFAGASGRN